MKSGLKVTHHNQEVTFRSSVFHMSAASVLFFLKDKYKHLDVAGLYEFLAKQLMASRKFTSASVNFTLVNVFSGDNGFSHGADVPPPEELRPAIANSHLVFTFAYGVDDKVSELGKVTVKNQRSNAMTQFGTAKVPTAFTSIGLTSQQCAELGLNMLYGEYLAYLYNLIGVMTKNLARNRKHYMPDSYESLYSTNLADTFDKIGQASLYQVMFRIPYHLWVFSPSMWRYAPNLLSTKMLNPQTVLYYFLYIHGTLTHQSIRDRVAVLIGLKEGKDTVVGILASSILEFVQNVNTPGYSHESALDVLAPAVIQDLVLTDTSKITPTGRSDSDQWNALKSAANTLAQAFADEDYDLGSLFLPPRTAAAKIFKSDRSYKARLTNELDFSKIGAS